jgi:hypothetical protein
MSQSSPMVHSQARDDFNKARSKATISSLLNALTPERQQLLSLEDVKNLVKPKTQTYKGMQTVDIDLIVGSEGRYEDFNATFLPKRDFIRGRWESIDRAHLSNITLPAIKLYEIGGLYFVRDGNHRVSVAKSQGVMAIDAEVIELDTELKFEPGMTRNDLKWLVIDYEKEQVYEQTELGKIIDKKEIHFTETGRWIELLRHIQGHKYFINQLQEEEIDFLEAAKSWYENIYLPITNIIFEENILAKFPGRSFGDLYMWIVKHWDDLKKKNGNNFDLKDAAIDYTERYGSSFKKKLKRISSFIRKALIEPGKKYFT